MKSVFCQISRRLKAPVWLKSPPFSLISTPDECKKKGGGGGNQTVKPRSSLEFE